MTGRRIVDRALAEITELFETGLADCHRPEDRKLVEGYLAALAPVLADAVLGKDIRDRLSDLERLLGHTWLIDQEPFEAALTRWRDLISDVTSPGR